MVIDLLKLRRSIRRFQDKEVEKEKINTILKGALLCPSSKGRRPWEFIAVTDKEVLNKLSLCREHSSHFLSGAPLGIVVIADPQISDVWVEDASIVSITMQLMAQSLGLGSSWIQMRERIHSEDVKAGDYVKQVLGIPEKYSVECIIAIGYPSEEKEKYDEDQLPYEKVHFNKF